MIFLLLALLLLLGLAAVGFATWPLLRGPAMRGRALLVAAVAALVLGLGLGSYLLLGSPGIALRSLTGPSDNDIRGLVAVLSRRVLQTPDDPRGWTLLGRGYLSLNDPSDAAAAFRRALAVAPQAQRSELLSAYAEALTLSAGGAVPPEAEAAFGDVLKSNPHDRAALFYLGQMAAQRGDTARALAMWNSLLPELPAQNPLRSVLLDRMAMLRARTGAVPDIHAMVEGLAARLKAHPDDADGWRRLVRAYAVLGEKEKAQQALSDGREALKSNVAGLSALNAEAAAHHLQMQNGGP
ncbi:MAG: tetratricopeptide repeat protein [Proteobacteria bacterium]|nr:tetratricopeptide repeat protein [Pseudomonadota bacterium]